MSRSRAGLLALALTAAGSTALAALTVPPAVAAPPADRPSRAEKAARAHPEQVALDDEDALTVRTSRTDADGTAHVRFDRTPIGVAGPRRRLVVHQAADGSSRASRPPPVGR